jgi:hypothetical protein
MPRLKLAVIACLTISVCGQKRAAPLSASAARQFVSTRYGFSIDSPPGWRFAALAGTELPIFVNFALSRLPEDLLLPNGGAMIHIVVADELSGRNRDLDEWVEFDQHGAVRETVSSRGFDMPASSGVFRAIISAFDERTYSPSEQRQHHVTVYWEFRGKQFATYLDYIVRDPKAKEYEHLLAKVMRSIRPLS